jgi:hypothetical protein
MRNLYLVVTLSFAVGAAGAGTPAAGGGGHGGGGASAAGASAAGASAAAHGSGYGAAHAHAAIDTRIGSSLGMRAAALRAESISRVTIDGREMRVATFKLRTPLSDSDRADVRFHGFSQKHIENAKQGAEVWCPDTLLSRQRGNSTCVAFVL